MIRFIYFVFIAILTANPALTKNLRQETASITCNPKYITDCHAITAPARHGEAHTTNMTGTTLQPWDYNVTITMILNPKTNGDAVALKAKVCDLVKVKWFRAHMLAYTNIPTSCPIYPGTYRAINMEFPPKDFPLPIPGGSMDLKSIFETADTKEFIAETLVHVHND